MQTQNYKVHLSLAIQAAKEAGAVLLSDFQRADGARGGGDKATADPVAETLIRDAIETAFPNHGVVGEELGERNHPPRNGEDHTWWIDPNDGTRAYLKGFRGAAVSIALVRAGEPVLGVVFAYAAPDDEGDLIAWAQGQPLTRNGHEVMRAPWPIELTSDVVVAVSQAADRRSLANADLVAPARFCAVTSIAYRLACVAVGDADVGVSLASPCRWDCAAGHALLIASGGELYNMNGKALRYLHPWSTDVIGGSPKLSLSLAERPWRKAIFTSQASRTPSFDGLDLSWPKPGIHVSDSAILSRAQGALLGQLAGDALGQMVEFQPAAQIASAYPMGVQEMQDGGCYNTVAGQPTDDSEMALVLARTLVRDGRYSEDALARGYANWLASGPYDYGNTTRIALAPAIAAVKAGTSPAEAARSAANPMSQANGALMRVSPLGIWGYALEPTELARLASLDAALTHPNPVCRDASALYAVAIAYAIRTGAGPHDVYAFAQDQAKALRVHEDIHATLEAAQNGPPTEFQHQMGWVRIAFANAFAQLLNAPNLQEGIVDTVNRGGDTDTNAAIAGALLGAVYGREAFPRSWRRRLVSCRPVVRPEVKHPRPRVFWPVDALLLSEELLVGLESSRPVENTIAPRNVVPTSNMSRLFATEFVMSVDTFRTSI